VYRKPAWCPSTPCDALSYRLLSLPFPTCLALMSRSHKPLILLKPTIGIARLSPVGSRESGSVWLALDGTGGQPRAPARPGRVPLARPPVPLIPVRLGPPSPARDPGLARQLS
jgi:hypothetical protein